MTVDVTAKRFEHRGPARKMSVQSRSAKDRSCVPAGLTAWHASCDLGLHRTRAVA